MRFLCIGSILNHFQFILTVILSFILAVTHVHFIHDETDIHEDGNDTLRNSIRTRK